MRDYPRRTARLVATPARPHSCRQLREERNGCSRCRWGKFKNMLRLHGVTLTPQDAANLADTLLAEGSPASVATAELIQRAVRLQFASVTLTPIQSEAIVAVLKDPLGRTLATLRDKLARDHRDGES